MPNVIFRDAAGNAKTIDCAVGTSLMRSAQLNSVTGIYAECSGQKMCATCHVYIADDFLHTLPDISDDENDMLDSTASDRLPNSRLSCAISIQPVHENMGVQLPEYQR